MSEERQADLEQPLYIADMLLVDHEQDDVVIAFYYQTVGGNQHLLSADHGANGGARRQLDIADGAADHLGGAGVAMGDDLDGLRRPTAQGVDVDDIAAADVCQQGTQGRMGWRDGNLDLTALHQIQDRKSTRLNSSHVRISYAVFC